MAQQTQEQQGENIVGARALLLSLKESYRRIYRERDQLETLVTLYASLVGDELCVERQELDELLRQQFPDIFADVISFRGWYATESREYSEPVTIGMYLAAKVNEQRERKRRQWHNRN